MSIQKFKAAYKQFENALKYIVENEQKLKTDPNKWKTVQKNFDVKFGQPVDAAWQELSAEEKKRFETMYLHRRSQIELDPIIQKAINYFGAKVVSVEEKQKILPST